MAAPGPALSVAGMRGARKNLRVVGPGFRHVHVHRGAGVWALLLEGTHPGLATDVIKAGASTSHGVKQQDAARRTLENGM